MMMRVVLILQIIVGIALWKGKLLAFVDIHRGFGMLYVFALWFIAILAIAKKHKSANAGFAMMWGVLIIVLGFAQHTILPGDNHWIVRWAHLIIGVVAIPMAEDLVKGGPLAVLSKEEV
jgi:hypothetical protein